MARLRGSLHRIDRDLEGMEKEPEDAPDSWLNGWPDGLLPWMAVWMFDLHVRSACDPETEVAGSSPAVSRKAA